MQISGPALASYAALQHIQRLHSVRQTTMTRMATAQSVNRGADAPSALIASEHLRAQIQTLDAQSRSLQRTANVIHTADASLREMSDALIQARSANVSLADSAWLSDGEHQALQSQVNQAVQTVDRLSSQSAFAGRPLLDGNTTLHAGDDELTLARTDSRTVGNVSQAGQTSNLSDLQQTDSKSDTALNESIIDQAFADVLDRRAQLGAFERYSVQSQRNSLDVQAQNTIAANSDIRDANMARQVSKLVRTRITGQAAIKAMQVDSEMRRNDVELLI